MKHKTSGSLGGFHKIWLMFIELFSSFIMLNLSLKFNWGLALFAIILPGVFYLIQKTTNAQLRNFTALKLWIHSIKNTRYVVQKYSIVILKTAIKSHQKVTKISNSKLIEFPSRLA